MLIEIEIEIDDALLAELNSRPGEGPARLRLILDRSAPTPPAVRPRGPLAPLLADGRLEPGDQLYWERPRRGERHTASVAADGSLTMAGRRYWSPSGAARAAAGVHVDGWNAWRRGRDDVLLARLRDDPAARPR
jgi:hypothetical protein